MEISHTNFGEHETVAQPACSAPSRAQTEQAGSAPHYVESSQSQSQPRSQQAVSATRRVAKRKHFAQRRTIRKMVDDSESELDELPVRGDYFNPSVAER
jgi:hypothetical protein